MVICQSIKRIKAVLSTKVTEMKNKQHAYILKAFLESNIPAVIRRDAPELMVIDSIIGGYCTQLVKGARAVELPLSGIISKADKAAFAELINQSKKKKKEDLVIYYRLALMAESVVVQYTLKADGNKTF